MAITKSARPKSRRVTMTQRINAPDGSHIVGAHLVLRFPRNLGVEEHPRTLAAWETLKLEIEKAWHGKQESFSLRRKKAKRSR